MDNTMWDLTNWVAQQNQMQNASPYQSTVIGNQVYTPQIGNQTPSLTNLPGTTNQNYNQPFTSQTIPPMGRMPGDNGPQSGPSPEEIRAEIERQRTINAINSGYDTYNRELENMSNTWLPQQKAAQEGIINSQLQSGLADLQGQKAEQSALLDTQMRKNEAGRARSLKDIGSNINNLMQAGNVYLGARGAGDSSAANMYSYALTKQGNKMRGDVNTNFAALQSDIDDRRFKLNNIFNTETTKINNWAKEQINQVALQFAQLQQQIRDRVGQLGQLKGTDIANLSKNALDIANQRLMDIQTQANNNMNMLKQWATAKATDLNSLMAQFQQISSGMGSIQQPPNLSMQGLFQGQTGRTYYPGVGYITDEEKRRLGLA
jgi:hypothetical protein